MTLRQLRVRAKLTQRQLAERAGLEQTTVSSLECGESRDPRLSTVRALARALRVKRDLVIRAFPEEQRRALAENPRSV